MTLVFSGFSFIPHLAHHFANFRRSLSKSFAANCTFLLAPIEQCHQRTGILSFVCGEDLVSHWRLSEGAMDSGQSPVEPL